MRTLKTCIIAASIFLFAIPATAATYPAEIQAWIEQSSDQFVCVLSSPLSVKFYLKPGGTIAIIMYDEQERIISRVDMNGGVNTWIRFVRLKDKWKAMSNLSKEEKNESYRLLQFFLFDADLPAIEPCVYSNLHNRGLR